MVLQKYFSGGRSTTRCVELGGKNLKYFESVNLQAEVDWQDNSVMKLSVEHVC